jgi:hypothetical protein
MGVGVNIPASTFERPWNGKRGRKREGDEEGEKAAVKMTKQNGPMGLMGGIRGRCEERAGSSLPLPLPFLGLGKHVEVGKREGRWE